MIMYIGQYLFGEDEEGGQTVLMSVFASTYRHKHCAWCVCACFHISKCMHDACLLVYVCG